MRRPFRVGRNCDAWCTRCREVTEHTIIALVEGLPKRVECFACGGQHNYRLPNGASSASGARSGGSTRPRAPRAEPARWQFRMAEKAGGGAESKAYSISESFEEGEVMDHSSFGVGIVEKVLPGDKIEVLFSSGKRLLVHRR